MKTTKELFGERIKARRVKMGKTQQDLATAAGTDRARVSEWERGQHEPKGEHRQLLLAYLGSTEREIFGIDLEQIKRPKSMGEFSPDEFAEAVAKKLAKPEPTGDRAELLRLIGTLDEDGVRTQLQTVRDYIAAKKSKRDDSSESRG